MHQQPLNPEVTINVTTQNPHPDHSYQQQASTSTTGTDHAYQQSSTSGTDHTTYQQTSSTSSSLPPPPPPLTNLTGIHGINPRPTIQRFDGSQPSMLGAFITDCENAAITHQPSLITVIDDETNIAFSNACLTAAIHRLDLSSFHISSCYQLWRQSDHPNWTSLKKQLKLYFLSPYHRHGQALSFIMNAKPTGTDRLSLLRHISTLNEPFRILGELWKADPNIAPLFNLQQLPKIRNYLFAITLLSHIPPKHHLALIDKISYSDEPSLTCTKLEEAILQLPNTPDLNPLPSFPSNPVLLAPQTFTNTLEPSPQTPLFALPVQPTPNNNHQATRQHQHQNTRPQTRIAPPNPTPSQSKDTRYTSRQQSIPGKMSNPNPWTPTPNTCFNCNEPGHTMPSCPLTPWCWFCKRGTHTWTNCRTFPDAVQAAKAIAFPNKQGFQSNQHRRPLL